MRVTKDMLDSVIAAVRSNFEIDGIWMPVIDEAVRLGYLVPANYWRITQAGEKFYGRDCLLQQGEERLD
jgi:hypothetical protein